MQSRACNVDINYGGRAIKKLFVYCMKIFSIKTAKQTYGSRLGSACGSRTEAMQRNKAIFKTLPAVIHKNKRNTACNSDKIVHPWHTDD